MGIECCRGRSAAGLRPEPFSSISFVSPQTREAASASWKARVLPTELHRVVCVCVFPCVCASVRVCVSMYWRLPALRLYSL